MDRAILHRMRDSVHLTRKSSITNHTVLKVSGDSSSHFTLFTRRDAEFGVVKMLYNHEWNLFDQHRQRVRAVVLKPVFCAELQKRFACFCSCGSVRGANASTKRDFFFSFRCDHSDSTWDMKLQTLTAFYPSFLELTTQRLHPEYGWQSVSSIEFSPPWIRRFFTDMRTLFPVVKCVRGDNYRAVHVNRDD